MLNFIFCVSLDFRTRVAPKFLDMPIFIWVHKKMLDYTIRFLVPQSQSLQNNYQPTTKIKCYLSIIRFANYIIINLKNYLICNNILIDNCTIHEALFIQFKTSISLYFLSNNIFDKLDARLRFVICDFGFWIWILDFCYVFVYLYLYSYS